MVAKDIRTKLKKCQPYFIEKELLPNLYFKEEDCDLVDEYGRKREVERWIMFYSLIRKLSDKAIGIRLGFEGNTIYKRTLKIIERNLNVIEDFLRIHNL